MAQPTTIPFTSLVRAPEPSGDTPPRHIPLSTSLRALPCVPSGLVVCAGLPEPCPTATGGSGFTIEIGSDFVIGPTGCRRVGPSFPPGRCGQDMSHSLWQWPSSVGEVVRPLERRRRVESYPSNGLSRLSRRKSQVEKLQPLALTRGYVARTIVRRT